MRSVTIFCQAGFFLMHQPSRKLSWLLIALLSLPVFSHGQVLCVGADGHWAIETAVAGKCCSDHASAPGLLHESVGQKTEDSHCGTCADFVISGANQDDRSAHRGGLISPVAVCLSLVLTNPLPSFSHAAFAPATPPILNTPLSHIRTVALLT